jgi:hypothetical protein
MGQNLDSSRGLIVGEAVMMGLAPFIGRNAAHDVVYECCKDCIEDGVSTLYDHLVKREDITSKVSLEQLQFLCEPRNYLGAAQRMVDDVIAQGQKTLSPWTGQNGSHVKTAKANGNGHASSNGHDPVANGQRTNGVA